MFYETFVPVEQRCNFVSGSSLQLKCRRLDGSAGLGWYQANFSTGIQPSPTLVRWPSVLRLWHSKFPIFVVCVISFHRDRASTGSPFHSTYNVCAASATVQQSRHHRLISGPNSGLPGQVIPPATGTDRLRLVLGAQTASAGHLTARGRGRISRRRPRSRGRQMLVLAGHWAAAGRRGGGSGGGGGHTSGPKLNGRLARPPMLMVRELGAARLWLVCPPEQTADGQR